MDDAVQDVVAKVLQSDARPDALRAWIFRIARNHCLNLRRDRARRRDAAPLPSGSALDARQTGFLTRLVQHERMDAIARAFATLSEHEQEALRLRYAEGLSRAEIAAITETTESVVKSRLFEGLAKLRARVPPSA